MDAIWIENMNTVLDDNKKLCLNSGEIIKMSNEMTMMFEVEDLAVASPATVSRCGMIFMEPTSLGLDTLVNSWIEYEIPDAAKPHGSRLQELFGIYFEPLSGAIFFLRRQLKEPVPTVDNNLISSTMRILNCYLKKYTWTDGDDPMPKELLDQLAATIEPLFYFALVWSVGCVTDSTGRDKFDQWLREKMADNEAQLPFPEDGSIYDYMLLEGEAAVDTPGTPPYWTGWLDTVPVYAVPPKARFEDIIVPTKDSVCYTYLLDLLTKNGVMTMHAGVSGTGKTVNVMRYMQTGIDPMKQLPLSLTFSAQTSANMTQDILDGKMDKRRKGVFGPPNGKKYLLLVDDLNMPKKEVSAAILASASMS